MRLLLLLPGKIRVSPAGNYISKLTIETLEPGMKYVQSYQ